MERDYYRNLKDGISVTNDYGDQSIANTTFEYYGSAAKLLHPSTWLMQESCKNMASVNQEFAQVQRRIGSAESNIQSLMNRVYSIEKELTVQREKNMSTGRGKSVLVTGGAGYIGSAIVPILLERGYCVTVYDNLLFGTNYVQAFMDKITFIQADICDPKAMKEALEGIDFVIHLAAIVGYPACDKDPELATETNVRGTDILLSAMNAKQRLVYASTGSCYGSNTREMCSEETPLNPLTVYGLTKAKAEAMCVARGHVALRLATLFGVSLKFRPDLLMHNLTAEAMKKGKIELYEAHFERTFLHVKDAARAFAMALENFDAMQGQVYNVGSELMNMTKLQMAEAIATIIPNVRVEICMDGEDKDKRNYKVSFDKISKFNFVPLHSIDEGIRESIAYYMSHGLDASRKLN